MKSVVLCDKCQQQALPNDSTTIHVELNGTTMEFIFHNRHHKDCLNQKLRELKDRFTPKLLSA